MKVSVAVFLLGAMCAAPVLGQGPGQGQAPPPPATDTVAPDIPGVVKAGTKVIVIKDDFQGTEGPIALPDGTLGLFHPDNFSFGQPVYLSRIIAAAQAVEGVDSVRPDVFQRLVDPSPVSLADGVIAIGRLEIAQLANDASFPDRGRLTLAARWPCII